MARHKRIQTPGLLRHVMARGNGGMRLFREDTDYRKLLFVLGDIVETFDIECWDFCVMPTHYHLALFPRKANISAAMRDLNGTFGTWWNPAHSTIGHVFQGRFKDQIVQREGYLRNLCRYIARNPVRARLVDDPVDWPWSGYAAIAGLRPNPGFLFCDPILEQFGDGDVSVLQARYREHVLGLVDDPIEERLRSKERVVGDREFKRQLREGRVGPTKRQLGGGLSFDRRSRLFMPL
jgi:putative transposase